MGKKSSTKDFEKSTDELAYTLLMDKKYSTKYFEKGTDELSDMKQKVNTISRKGLDQFEGLYIRSKGWFKFDNEFLKQLILKLVQNFINNCLKRVWEIKTWKCIKVYCTV